MGGTFPVRATPVSQRTVSRRVPLPGPRTLPLLALVAVLVLASLPAPARSSSRAEDLVLHVGQPGDIWTRNLLPAIANDIWTTNVLYRVYGSPLLENPDGSVMAYIAKGTDFNEDGIFEQAEYNTWAERPSPATPLVITVYYDFNGVRWHDGTPTTAWDLFFSYHVNAMNPRFNTGLRVLSCDPSPMTTYESCQRQLGIRLVSKNWEGESNLPGDPNLRVAVRYTLNQPFAPFYTGTLYPVMFPMHEWSRAGGGRHADFGCAVWIPSAEATRQGIPECGMNNAALYGQGVKATDTVPGSKPYDYPSAEGWLMTDADVIGNGPFRFQSWKPGVEVRLVRNDEYFVGVNPTDPTIVYDAALARDLRGPMIEGIRFTPIVRQLAAFALRGGDIDFYTDGFDQGVAIDLYTVPEIAVAAIPRYGYAYLEYNMRKSPFGYEGDDPTRDVGLPLRQAVSHLIDKESVVQNFLNGFGYVAQGFVSPASSFWYDDTLPSPSYDPARARVILDSAQARALGFGPDPPGPCAEATPEGCRSLPRIGDASFEIQTYATEPGRSRALEMVAASMREAGLNAVLVFLTTFVPPFWQYYFDMLALSWSIAARNDPGEYLFSFFHGSNSATGQNYAGFRNATFDRCIESALVEMNRIARRGILSWCQRILADARPAEPLYFRANVEAYRADRFVNWTASSGTIWNDWSLLRIHPPGDRSLRVSIDAGTVVPSEGTEPVTFVVRDGSGEPIPGATIRAGVASTSGDDPGILTGPGGNGTNLTLITDAGGRATATYRAPLLNASTRPVALRASASEPNHETADAQFLLTVVGRTLRAMQVQIDLPAGDLTAPGDPLPVKVCVLDASGSAVPDARVSVQIQPAGSAVPSQGPSANLTSVIVVLPSAGAYRIAVNATQPGYVDAWAYATVSAITPTPPPGIPKPGGQPDSTSTVLAGIGMAVAAATAASILVVRTRRRRIG